MVRVVLDTDLVPADVLVLTLLILLLSAQCSRSWRARQAPKASGGLVVRATLRNGSRSVPPPLAVRRRESSTVQASPGSPPRMHVTPAAAAAAAKALEPESPTREFAAEFTELVPANPHQPSRRRSPRAALGGVRIDAGSSSSSRTHGHTKTGIQLRAHATRRRSRSNLGRLLREGNVLRRAGSNTNGRKSGSEGGGDLDVSDLMNGAGDDDEDDDEEDEADDGDAVAVSRMPRLNNRHTEIKVRQVQTHYQLMWDDPQGPSTALLVKKHHDAAVTERLDRVARYLSERCGIQVFVEPVVHENELPHWPAYQESERDQLTHIIDFVVSLGGDGTLMYISSLFPRSVPPVMAIHSGSLGFLAPFDIARFESDVDKLLHGSVTLMLRTRLKARVFRLETDASEAGALPYGRLDATHVALNDIVLNRGNDGALSNVEAYCDDRWVTRVQADGIIVATTTGSTAYSVAAGGSIVHPTVPGILFTPICPHSLSFRPIIFPDSVELRLTIPLDARSACSISFDGRNCTQLNRGDSVVITQSRFPIPTVARSDPTSDWLKGIREALLWNKRKRQGNQVNSPMRGPARTLGDIGKSSTLPSLG